MGGKGCWLQLRNLKSRGGRARRGAGMNHMMLGKYTEGAS